VVIAGLGAAKPNELVRASIVRARMCEKFSTVFNTKFTVDELFTLGLFSLMDALLDCRMEDILSNISFSDKMKNALMGNDREFSRMLDIIIGFETGNWENAIFKAMAGSAIEAQFPEMYFTAVKMANAFYC
ncbi:MAG: signal transduction protein, partial [Proteobacteria bacterium]|nr:signal transduction protein [Pseudomonadota bacterium]